MIARGRERGIEEGRERKKREKEEESKKKQEGIQRVGNRWAFVLKGTFEHYHYYPITFQIAGKRTDEKYQKA